MGIAFVLLRLSPRDFWSMSPLELSAALHAIGLSPGQALKRDELRQLMEQFPDGGNPETMDGR